MEREARKLSRRDTGLFWYGVLAAPLAWTVHLTVAYGYDEAACSNETGVAAVEPLILALTGALGAAALAGLVAATLSWRRAVRGTLDDPREWVQVLAFASVVSSVVFLFAIVLQGVQVLVLSACGAG